MCVIGVVYSLKGGYFLFKNRDLQERPSLPEPMVLDAPIRRIVFPSAVDTTSVIWGGVNQHGLSLQFADAYSTTTPSVNLENRRQSVRTWHSSALASCRSASDAADMYVRAFNRGDMGDQIGLFADPGGAVIIENVGDNLAMEWLRTRPGYLLRTNVPMLLRSIAPEFTAGAAEFSAYCRYQRALALVSSTDTPDLTSIRSLLCDSRYGETDLSIRRVGVDGHYQTTSSLIVEASAMGYTCHYVLRGPPNQTDFRELTLGATVERTHSE